jgi:adenylate kinase family enzyme
MSVNVIIIGPPGSGVRTQAQLLARARPMPILSSGLLLREAVADEYSPLGKRAKLFIDAGKVRREYAWPGLPEAFRRSSTCSACVVCSLTCHVPSLLIPCAVRSRRNHRPARQ